MNPIRFFCKTVRSEYDEFMSPPDNQNGDAQDDYSPSAYRALQAYACLIAPANAVDEISDQLKQGHSDSEDCNLSADQSRCVGQALAPVSCACCVVSTPIAALGFAATWSANESCEIAAEISQRLTEEPIRQRMR